MDWESTLQLCVFLSFRTLAILPFCNCATMCLPISCRRSLVLLNPPSCRSQQTRSKSSKFSNRTNAIRPDSWSIGDLGQQSIPTTVLVFQSGSFNFLIPGACIVTCTQQVTTSYKTFFIINTVIVDFKKNGLCWALPQLPILLQFLKQCQKSSKGLPQPLPSPLFGQCPKETIFLQDTFL